MAADGDVIKNSEKDLNNDSTLPVTLINLRIDDLFYSNHSSTSKFHREIWAYFSYIFRVIDYLFVTIYLDWTIIFRHPLNFIIIISFFSLTTFLLFLYGIGIAIPKYITKNPDDLVTQTTISQWANVSYDNTLTISRKLKKKLEKDGKKSVDAGDIKGDINAINTTIKEIELLLSALPDDNNKLNEQGTLTMLVDGIKSLGENPEETPEETPDNNKDKKTGVNNNKPIKDDIKEKLDDTKENLKKLNKLKALLYFSTVVYRRESKITSILHNCIRKLKNNLKHNKQDDDDDDVKIMQDNQKVRGRVYIELKKGNNEGNNEGDKEEITFSRIEDSIRDLIKEREDDKCIIKELKELNKLEDLDIEFTTISELNTDDGRSFCGMFWSKKERFIVVSFKGTSFNNYAEWINNLTFQSVDARDYLFGQVHKGFYNYLFPRDIEEVGDNYPCQIIINSVECIAKTFDERDKVNLWITGHSLGGALATLFYARLLKIDFNKHSKYCQLQGAVTFAGPAVGDNHFAAELASLINDPRNESNPLWRVVLNNDPVPKTPYRACRKSMRKYGYNYNVLMNFSQVGNKIIFYGDEKKPFSIKEYFSGRSNKDDREIYCEKYDLYFSMSTIEKEFKRFWNNLKSLRYLARSHMAVEGYFTAFIEYENKLNSRQIKLRELLESKDQGREIELGK